MVGKFESDAPAGRRAPWYRPRIGSSTPTRRDFLVAAAIAGSATAFGQPSLDSRVLDVFAAINSIRFDYGLSPLEWDDRVAAAARAHAGNMATRNFFSHHDPVFGDLPSRLERASIGWRTCSENLFQEHGYSDPAAVAVQSWMDSPGHRKNILSPNVTRTGIGLSLRSDGSYWFDQIFIRPWMRSGIPPGRRGKIVG